MRFIFVIIFFNISLLADKALIEEDFDKLNKKTFKNIELTRGKEGKAASFDGESSLINLPTPFKKGHSGVSVSFFIKPKKSDIKKSYENLISIGSHKGISIRFKQEYTLSIGAGTHHRIMHSLKDQKYNRKWIHILVTRDKKEVKLYIDNVLIDTAQCPEKEQYNIQDILIGAAYYDGDKSVTEQHYEGLIDELKIYDKVIHKKSTIQNI